MASYVPELALITLVAAVVNGALGYGFSSITVPLALLFLTSRVLNPALVLIEVVLNAYVLLVNRDSFGAIYRRVLPIVVGLVPGVIVGTLVVARVHPDWLKFGDLHAAAAADSRAGGRLPAADPLGTRHRRAVRDGRGPALLAHHDFRAAAGGDAEQPGARQAGVPRGARLHPARRIVASPPSPTSMRACSPSRASR